MSKDATTAVDARPLKKSAKKLTKAGAKAKPKAKADADAIPLRGYLDKVLEGLRHRVARAIKGDVEAVHQSRVATRRLKAATDLLAPVLPPRELKPFRKVLRGLRRLLGPLRDADVTLGHVEDAAAGTLGRPPANAAALAWLAGQLREARAEALRQVQSRVDRAKTLGRLGLWWALRDALADAEGQVAGLLSASLRRQIDSFGVLADRLCDSSLGRDTTSIPAEAPAAASDAAPSASAADQDVAPALFPEATPLPAVSTDGEAIPTDSVIAPIPETVSKSETVSDPETAEAVDPHAVRIAGKLLRYALELADAHGTPLPARVARSFKDMQEALGAWHDAVVLAERAMELSVRGQLALHDSARQQGVLAVARHFLRRSDVELTRFARLWRSRGGQLSATIRNKFDTSATKPPELNAS